MYRRDGVIMKKPKARRKQWAGKATRCGTAQEPNGFGRETRMPASHFRPTECQEDRIATRTSR
ncbi:hypothetical protein FRUB_06828 [Fimbriiglobus ruber]|uniref:Uncharacterized protein n=1 Tax=Fimbriiglobus ruber TaxID=1908690 RepID=A0A225DGP6_9BACT|nr:hypothetical protein FRUB_06828 [Fimbriiglobus ruber]